MASEPPSPPSDASGDATLPGPTLRHDAPSGPDRQRTLLQNQFDDPTLPSSNPITRAESAAPSGFEILGELGRGGMGVVYRARQTSLHRDVALKTILTGSYASASSVGRFWAEAEVVAKLQHPHIVAIHELGVHDGRPFFSMEYCPRGSLAQLIASDEKLPPRRCAELVQKAARGVAAANAAGIIHRDLKPGNILLSSTGEPKVADFGLAKNQSLEGLRRQYESTASGALLGTPSYMAPEQASSARNVGATADVYSLGAILYELLTGAPPFRGPTSVDTLILLLMENPRPPRDVNADVPRDLEAICLRCMEKDPKRRYQSADELAADLSRFLDNEPIVGARSGLMDRMVGALERVPLHDQFAAYGTLLWMLIPVMFLAEVWITIVVRNDWPGQYLALGQLARIAAFIGIVWYFHGWRIWPQSAVERKLWFIWASYLLVCFVFGLSSRLGRLLFATEMELDLYPGLASITAFAFFALTIQFWGYCAVIGFAFLCLAFVMTIDMRWAPLEFGAVWAIVLLIVGRRLRAVGATYRTTNDAAQVRGR